METNVNEFGLEIAKANELTQSLDTILNERTVLIDAYNDVITLEINEDNLATFKDLRLRIRDNRTKGIMVWHKTNKEFYLRAGQFIDAVKNREIAENERMEEALMKAEKHFEDLEKARLKAVHDERVQKLLPFGYEIGSIDFSQMDENLFDSILFGAEAKHKQNLEIAAKAEADRLEAIRIEEEKRAAERAEMDRLKAENDAKEKALAEQRAEADKILRETEARLKAEANEKARLDKIESDKQAAIIAEQRKALAKIEAEKKAKLAAEKKAAAAPEKQKLQAAIDMLDFRVEIKTDEGKAIQSEIINKLDGFKTWATKLIQTL